MGQAAGYMGGMTGMIGGGAMGKSGANMQGAAAQGGAIDAMNQAGGLYNYFMSQAGDNSKQLNLLAANPDQLQSLTQSLQIATQQNDADHRLMNAIDPAIMEASKQALSILQGGTASVNQPFMQQISNQRSSLVNSLKEQYGPGAETSAIGQQALRQFDLQNNTTIAQNQQQSLSQLFGLSQQGAGLQSQLGSAMQGRSLQSAQGFGSYAGQQIGAQAQGFGQMSQGMLGFGGRTIDTAGANFVGDQVRGAGKQQMGHSYMNAGAQMIGGANQMMSGGGKKSGGGGGK